jgi:hypothetical protein
MVPRRLDIDGRRSNAQGSALIALTNITAGTARTTKSGGAL